VTGPPVVTRLTGVYHADGGVRGELAYVVGKLRGTAHCGLCDITHRGVRAKREWVALCDGGFADTGVPFDLVHLDERGPEVTLASEGGTPCVLAHTGDGLVVLLGPSELDSVGGSVDAFAALLRERAASAGLRWPDR
jgi:hypothetical protein